MYTTISQIEYYLGIEFDTAFHNQVEEWISEIEVYINNLTRTKFEADETDQEYYYDGNNRDILFIDDFISVSSVELGDWDGTNMQVIEPVIAPNRIPKYKLVYNCFTKGVQNVKIIGRQGYSETAPKDIQRAATILTAGVIHKEGAKEKESLGDYSVSYKSERGISDFENALKIINAYQKNV